MQEDGVLQRGLSEERLEKPCVAPLPNALKTRPKRARRATASRQPASPADKRTCAEPPKAKAAAATHLPKFEAILSDASPYCCGAEPNWADFQLLVRYRPRHPFFSFAARTHFSVRLPFSIISHARRSLPAYAVRVKLH